LRVAAGDQLLGLALAETHHRDPVAPREPPDRARVGGADLAERRRRGDREAAIEQEPHHLTLGLQLRHIARQEDPIDRIDPERHPLPQ
jgi:hypothetical protein